MPVFVNSNRPVYIYKNTDCTRYRIVTVPSSLLLPLMRFLRKFPFAQLSSHVVRLRLTIPDYRFPTAALFYSMPDSSRTLRVRSCANRLLSVTCYRPTTGDHAIYVFVCVKGAYTHCECEIFFFFLKITIRNKQNIAVDFGVTKSYLLIIIHRRILLSLTITVYVVPDKY